MTADDLQQRLGYPFRTPALLAQALTHRSHGQTHNERLEFLGDSVLNCAVAALLYEKLGKMDEGDLSRVRANLVKQQALFEIAQRLELSQCLLLGEGERKSGGFRRPSILADTLEAVLGAVFLDGGFDAAQQVIRRLYEPILKHIDPKTLGKDAKTLLQEWLQSRKIPLPVYSVVATHGAAHNQMFEVECSVPKLGIQVLGSGGSRRAAEQGAAKLAFEQAQVLMPANVRKPRKATPAADLAAPALSVAPSVAPSAAPSAEPTDTAPSNDPAASSDPAVPPAPAEPRRRVQAA
jgi:ribonuclease III